MNKHKIGGNTDSWFGGSNDSNSSMDDDNNDSNDDDDIDCNLYLYLCTGYCEQTLRDCLMDTSTNVEPSVIWRRFRQFLEGLAYIHEHDEIRIGDFGLAAFNTDTQNNNNNNDKTCNNNMSASYSLLELTSGIGTLLYISPEQSGQQSRSRFVLNININNENESESNDIDSESNTK